MKSKSKFYIFDVLKVVCGGASSFHFSSTCNNLAVSLGRLRSNSYLTRFFIALMKYISAKYDNHIQLPLALIREATACNWLDSLIYYIWLKKLYTKPVFYNYSLRKLATLLQCSPSTISHHIAILSQKGLCFNDGANLRLKSIISHRKDGGLMVPVAISKNKAEQRMYLRYAIIKRNLHSQVRINSTKNDVIKFHKDEITDFKQYKALIKVAKNYPPLKQLESSVQNVLTLSNNKIGKLTNRSQSTGIKIQRAFNNLLLIRSTKRVSQVSILKTDKRGFFEQVLTSHHFLTNKGYVFKRLSNGIELVGSEYSSISKVGHPLNNI